MQKQLKQAKSAITIKISKITQQVMKTSAYTCYKIGICFKNKTEKNTFKFSHMLYFWIWQQQPKQKKWVFWCLKFWLQVPKETSFSKTMIITVELILLVLILHLSWLCLVLLLSRKCRIVCCELTCRNSKSWVFLLKVFPHLQN
jgi:hypothetical protein